MNAAQTFLPLLLIYAGSVKSNVNHCCGILCTFESHTTPAAWGCHRLRAFVLVQ